MITVNKKWIRLIGIVGCTVWMASCKQAPDAGVKSSYAVMQIEPTDKNFLPPIRRPYAGDRILISIRRCREQSRNSA